jgi:hypothetical protein
MATLKTTTGQSIDANQAVADGTMDLQTSEPEKVPSACSGGHGLIS